MDKDFDRCDRDENYVPSEASISQPRTTPASSREDTAMMNEFRESIALGLLNHSWQFEWCNSNVTCLNNFYGWGIVCFELNVFELMYFNWCNVFWFRQIVHGLWTDVLE